MDTVLKASSSSDSGQLDLGLQTSAMEESPYSKENYIGTQLTRQTFHSPELDSELRDEEIGNRLKSEIKKLLLSEQF
jgi:hypothetical protein